jgi:hypothetical protein
MILFEERLVSLPPTPDDPRVRALLLLILLAREADLPLAQVDSPQSRAAVVRGLARRSVRRRHSTSGRSGLRPWMCRHRWTPA